MTRSLNGIEEDSKTWPTHWMPLPSAPGSVPTSNIATINGALRTLANVWELDGDLMRCRGCGRALIASLDGEALHHSAECKHSERGHPWVELRSILSSVPTSVAGQGTDARPCTCHPDDNPPVPCPQKYASSECQSSQPTAGGDAPTDREMVHFLHSVVRNALQWHEDHRVEVQKIGPGTIPQWVMDGWAVVAAAPMKLKSDALSAERARVIATLQSLRNSLNEALQVAVRRGIGIDWDAAQQEALRGWNEADAALRALGADHG